MIYLDYQATTPLSPEVRTAMLPWLDHFANPHSPSRWGREAAAAIEHARGRVAALLPSGGETIFTSGATEALNMALRGTTGRIVTLATEHAAVLDTVEWLARHGRDVEVLPVRADGLVDLDHLRDALRKPTGLVAAMLVNNEIGVIQPVAEIAEAAHEAGALMLCDAVQGYGRMPVPSGPDLVAISAHKVYGPKGIGALWTRDGVTVEPLLHGGGQERGLRSGTLSPMLCAGFGEAAALARRDMSSDADHVRRLHEAALQALGPGWIVNGSTGHRYAGNLNLRRPGLDSARLIADCRSIAFSLGSACASGSGRPSHVLRAIGLSDAEARSSIRLGFGRYTTKEDVVEACALIRDAAEAQQQFAA
ncbi:cysteine desulfurase family protein [Sphingomonas sp. LHG3406-1]|uniref:cysteine desulfurase family protein n=1 Tax=Sphingomonas sp. LHG3406-1 TaxID=2804617 RepID=UPI00261FC279|nr:cysteine desulfurase family protein [Sphingomonas sp. LHG3406-1]